MLRHASSKSKVTRLPRGFIGILEHPVRISVVGAREIVAIEYHDKSVHGIVL